MSNENIIDAEIDQKRKERKLDQTRSAIVGTLAGLIIVTIIMVAVGGGAWWSYIAILGVGYGLFDQIVEYQLISRNTPRKIINALKGATGAWFGFIIVTFIMSSLFGIYHWIALIVEVGTFFGGVYATMDYYKAKRKFYDNAKNLPESVDIDMSETRGEEPRGDTHYCPVCGNQYFGKNDYCPSCGNQL